MMDSIKNLLQNSNLSTPVLRGVRAAEVLEIAEKVLINEFGPTVDEFVKPAYFRRDCLTIACLSSTAAQELKLRETVILEQINANLKGARVVRLKYMS